MAAVDDRELPPGRHSLLESEVDSIKCLNSLALKEQLQFVPGELESAKTIISLLKEDNNLTCLRPLPVGSLQSKPAVNRPNVADSNWNPIKHKTNKKKTPLQNITRVTKPSIKIRSVNRFSPLHNKVNRGNEINPVNNNLQVNQGSETTSVNISVKHNIRKNSTGFSKIPTIINGIVKSSDIQNSCKPRPQPLNDKSVEKTTHTHKVHIIGDSNFKGITAKVNQYLGSDFVISGFIKPGASIKQIVDTQKNRT
jgi:hypothetical protein